MERQKDQRWRRGDHDTEETDAEQERDIQTGRDGQGRQTDSEGTRGGRRVQRATVESGSGSTLSPRAGNGTFNDRDEETGREEANRGLSDERDRDRNKRRRDKMAGR